jgi:hypothetical protein
VLGKGGTLMGTGSVGGSVSNFGGTIRPGFSPGTLTIAGDYVDVGGHIEIEIGGPTNSDFIDVAGNLSLKGTSIEFKFIDGFAPAAGFTYDFIDADGSVVIGDDLTDKPVTYSFSGLQPGFQFDVSDIRRCVLTFTARTAGTALPEPGLPALLGAGRAGRVGGVAGVALPARGHAPTLGGVSDRPATRPPPPKPTPSWALIDAELARLAASALFRRSPRHLRFLRHLVQCSLNGEAARLREVALGVEVFLRPAERFDPRRTASCASRRAACARSWRAGTPTKGPTHDSSSC